MASVPVGNYGQPLPGTYMIYSRALGPAGERLAATFNGSQRMVTVTSLDTSDTKQHVSKFGLPVYVKLS
jgi:hypothetical protein